MSTNLHKQNRTVDSNNNFEKNGEFITVYCNIVSWRMDVHRAQK